MDYNIVETNYATAASGNNDDDLINLATKKEGTDTKYEVDIDDIIATIFVDTFNTTTMTTAEDKVKLEY